MSAALNRADTSALSIGTHPDLSLGSLASGFSTPARKLRIPTTTQSSSPSSAPISTPSPPNVPTFARKKADEATPVARRFSSFAHEEDGEDGGADVLDTPGREKKWGDTLETPAVGRMVRTRSTGAKGGVNLTLRDQEKVRLYAKFYRYI